MAKIPEEFGVPEDKLSKEKKNYYRDLFEHLSDSQKKKAMGQEPSDEGELKTEQGGAMLAGKKKEDEGGQAETPVVTPEGIGIGKREGSEADRIKKAMQKAKGGAGVGGAPKIPETPEAQPATGISPTEAMQKRKEISERAGAQTGTKMQKTKRGRKRVVKQGMSGAKKGVKKIVKEEGKKMIKRGALETVVGGIADVTFPSLAFMKAMEKLFNWWKRS